MESCLLSAHEVIGIFGAYEGNICFGTYRAMTW